MGSAAIVGIEEDSCLATREFLVMSKDGRNKNRVAAPSGTEALRKFVKTRQESINMATKYIVLIGNKDSFDNSGMGGTPYRTMGEGSEDYPSAFL